VNLPFSDVSRNHTCSFHHPPEKRNPQPTRTIPTTERLNCIIPTSFCALLFDKHWVDNLNPKSDRETNTRVCEAVDTVGLADATNGKETNPASPTV